MARNSTRNRVLNKIKRLPRGRAYCAKDFELGVSRRVINQALHRLAQEGEIRRVAQGIYERPKLHPRYGPMPPSLEEVAQASLRKVEGPSAKLQPSGAAAANALGLSQQVPARTVYLTTGRSRRVNVQTGSWQRELEFRHVEPGQLIEPGTAAGSLLQAVRFLREEGIVPERIAALARRLPESERNRLAGTSARLPGWAYSIVAPAFDSSRVSAAAA